jgi:hypothetical protein
MRLGSDWSATEKAAEEIALFRNVIDNTRRKVYDMFKERNDRRNDTADRGRYQQQHELP